jgi:hypothetical protein
MPELLHGKAQYTSNHRYIKAPTSSAQEGSELKLMQTIQKHFVQTA